MSITRSEVQRQLIEAVEFGQVAELARGLALGGDVDFRMDSGLTLAMVAAYKGNPECLALLIKAESDVNAVNHEGWTPAMYSAYIGHAECLARLISVGSDLSIQSVDQDTALSLALSGGHTECVEMIRSGLEAQSLQATLGSVKAPVRTQPDRKLRV